MGVNIHPCVGVWGVKPEQLKWSFDSEFGLCPSSSHAFFCPKLKFMCSPTPIHKTGWQGKQRQFFLIVCGEARIRIVFEQEYYYVWWKVCMTQIVVTQMAFSNMACLTVLLLWAPLSSSLCSQQLGRLVKIVYSSAELPVSLGEILFVLWTVDTVDSLALPLSNTWDNMKIWMKLSQF